MLTSSDRFAATIADFAGVADALISSHNIEHCEDPPATLTAVCAALKPGGLLYCSFPSEASVDFPRRKGGLNFYDDPTHVAVPRLEEVLAHVTAEGVRPVVVKPRYRPFILAAAGVISEPVSLLLKRNMPFGVTWALYGFETVIWGEKPA